MFEYRKSLRGDSIFPIRDYKLNEDYAKVAKRGDVVKLNASGEVVAAAANDTEVLGVFLGREIKTEAETDFYGKVQASEGMVFEATVSGTGNVVVGAKHPIALTDGDYSVNLDSTSNAAVKIIEATDRGTAYVTFINLQQG